MAQQQCRQRTYFRLKQMILAVKYTIARHSYLPFYLFPPQNNLPLTYEKRSGRVYHAHTCHRRQWLFGLSHC